MKKYNLSIDKDSIEWVSDTVGFEENIKDNLWYKVTDCYEYTYNQPSKTCLFFVAHKKPGVTIHYEIIRELFVVEEGKIITVGSKVPLEKIVARYKQKLKDTLYITEGWSVEEHIINDMN